MKMFELKDVVSLLRSEVRRVGSQAAFARKSDLRRVEVNRALTGARLPSHAVIDALGLAPVYVFKTDLPRRSTMAGGRRDGCWQDSIADLIIGRSLSIKGALCRPRP